MKMQDSIFREYDIRGVVDRDFDSAFAYALGRAYAGLVKEQSGKTTPKVAVGQDCRLSGPELSGNLMRGLADEGVQVVSTGVGPTPQLYYIVFADNTDGGIQVTGSHNPGDQNGFKMMVGKGTLSGSAIQNLKQRVKALAAKPTATQAGEIVEIDARSRYLAELTERSRPHMGSRKLKVVVDGGNGVGGLVGPQLLRNLGCEVIELYTDPDGRFPNHHPDPTVLENIEEMIQVVRKEGADVGIAWDGDADRIGVVDENGEAIFGDLLLLVYGRQLLKEVSKPIIIGDVKCSELLFSTLAKEGAQAVMWKTGHSLIKAKLKELHAHLAGEMSGHMFFAHRYYGYDDAIHASARLVEILSSSDKTLSELLSDVPKMHTTPEIRFDCPEEIKFKVAERAQSKFGEYKTSTLDGVRITFPDGWGLVRASNTQPVLVMRFEATSAAKLVEYQTLVTDRVKEIITELS